MKHFVSLVDSLFGKQFNITINPISDADAAGALDLTLYLVF